MPRGQAAPKKPGAPGLLITPLHVWRTWKQRAQWPHGPKSFVFTQVPLPTPPPPRARGGKAEAVQGAAEEICDEETWSFGGCLQTSPPTPERRISFTTKTSPGRGDMSLASSPWNVSGQRCLSISPERDIIFIFLRLPIVRTSLNKALNTQKAYRNTRFMENYLPAT